MSDDRQAQETHRLNTELRRVETEAAQRQAALDRATLTEFYARQRAAQRVT